MKLANENQSHNKKMNMEFAPVKFWMLWNPQGRAPTFKHETLEDARKQAEKLARNNNGETFYVLEAISYVRKKDVDWTELSENLEEYLPF
jgi:hypothetical protein